MRIGPKRWLALAASSAVALSGVAFANVGGADTKEAPTKNHVILISVDGLHQSDLDWYVKKNPQSALAKLVGNGIEYTNAQTPVPSDSYPGITAQFTGGNPSSTGIYYDDTWNHALLPAGTTPATCATAKPGVEVTYMEALDKNPDSISAGGTVNGPLPASILSLTGNADQLIDATKLPVDPASCQPVYPHSYLKVNTIFEVARTAGLRTAWSDKHAAYEIANGPSGTGVQDLFTPEINSTLETGTAGDWTTDNTLTQQYDSYKVQAVINEINGFDHSGMTKVGTPNILGMNFQTVSTAQKLPLSKIAGQGTTLFAGGYLPGTTTPGPVLSSALDYINTQIKSFVDAVHAKGLDDTTAIVLSAKHGQSPVDPNQLLRIPDGPIFKALDAAWLKANPTGVQPLTAFTVNDDAMMIWLNDRSSTATEFAKNFLLNYSSTATAPNPGNDSKGTPKGYTSAGLKTVYAGGAAANFFKVQPGDPRVPDLVGVVNVGVVYTGKKAKIAEHGGANPADRHVPIVVSGNIVDHHKVVNGSVETTQIAPTILQLLDLNPRYLQAVNIEGTEVLPGV